jgi:hypothetical protein
MSGYSVTLLEIGRDPFGGLRLFLTWHRDLFLPSVEIELDPFGGDGGFGECANFSWPPFILFQPVSV